MDVRLPDGTVIRGVPDGMTKAELTTKLKANGYDVSGLMPKAPQQDFSAEADVGPMEAGLIAAGRGTDRLIKGAQQLYYGAKSQFERPTLSSLIVGKPSQQKLM